MKPIVAIAGPDPPAPGANVPVGVVRQELQPTRGARGRA